MGFKYGRDLYERGADATHDALRQHPNFSFPPLPKDWTGEDLAAWITDTVAAYVSPPKVDDEDEHFSCQDLAHAIRTRLKPEILRRLTTRDG